MEYIPYKGKSEEDMWLYLDELERLDLDRDAWTDTFDVMEEISQELAGLRRLVERYSGSFSSYVFGYVAAAVSHFAREATSKVTPDTAALDEIIELTFKMLQDVRWLTAQPHTLGGLLSTIQMLIWSGGWNKNLVPNTFAEILQRCLRFGWANEAGSDFIQRGAVEILIYMSKAKILSSSFDKEQIKWFQDEVKRYQAHLKPDDSLKNITLDFSEAEDSEDTQSLIENV
jgi:hypothetical protein